jgi:ubiquinone/menaquinone biosynthesis C-methylase UbiE
MSQHNLDKNNRETWARDTAIAVHDRTADWFNQQYNKSQDFYGSPFLYGRRLIDQHFRKTIDKLPKNSKILDVGCGTGDQIKDLLKNGFEVIGIEPSYNMRKYAESKLPAGTVLDGSILNIPFPNNYFEFAYAIEVLRYFHHNDKISGLKEIYRVLKPGGIFFGTFVSRYALDGFAIISIIRRISEWLLKKPQTCHVEFESPMELVHTLRSIGFKKVEIHGAMFAFLRIIYKINYKLGRNCARIIEPYDKLFCDKAFLRAFAGHLIGIVQK